jgi:hypothetical protein
MTSPASKFIRDMRELFLGTGLNLDLGNAGEPLMIDWDCSGPGAQVVLDPGVQQFLDPRGDRESGPSPDFCEIFVLLSRAEPGSSEQIAVRAGDHRVGMVADADSGAFQALVEQGSQLDRPVITEAYRDRAPDNSWRLTVYKPKTGANGLPA